RRRHRQRDLADQSVAVAREARVPGDLDLDVEVTGRASPGADLTLAGQLDAVAVVDARGHVDLQTATRAHTALAVALAARVGDDGAVAVARGARPRRADVAQQRALDVLDRAVAVARAARDRLGALVGAAAVADLARDGGVDLDVAGDAERGLGERDRQAQQGVLAALRARARSARRRRLAEEGVHDVVEAEALPEA